MDNPGISRRPERDGGAEDPGIGALDIDEMDNLGIHIPDADGEKKADNPSGGVDNLGTRISDADGDERAENSGGRADIPGTCRQPESDREDVPDADKEDGPGSHTLDADGDGGIDNLGGGADNPGTSRR